MLLPSGTVTFLFTDVEGSTRLWERHPDAMQAAMARHDALLRAAVEAHAGAVVKTTGDGLHAAFASAASASAAALAAQQSLAAEPWDATGPLRVRMALHTGEAQYRDGDYYGPALNRAARLMAAAHGGQVLLSAATAALVRETLAGPRLVDLGEHRLRDLALAERVYQLAAPGLPAEFPPLRSLEGYAHNLPAQLTGFVGREREMAEVKRLLAGSRLLTLTGPGGTGKTRLALQVAADLLPAGRYPDGAWLVELAPISDPALVPQAIAAALGVREQPGRSLDDVLLDFLRYKHLLLLLDNCEHLVAACARTAEWLLRAAPGLTILASGREALAIAGEVIYQVPSLRLPAEIPAVPSRDGSGPPPAGLLDSEAVCLFVDRAQAVRPDFRLTAANAPAVVEICRRLDGIPLAIELAAARVKLLPVDQIAARLGDRFRLLTGGSRTALPRQQTLQALIDWSWDLLPEPERVLLRRLSVLSGGWTLPAAESVTSSPPPSPLAPVLGGEGWGEGQAEGEIDLLDTLSQLVNKSLVLADVAGGDAEGRYRLLETIRQYARDRLLEAGETAALRDRHAAFFLALAEEARLHLTGPDMIPWLDRLDAERDNLRVAMEWLMDGRPDLALRLAGAVEMYWTRRMWGSEARRWLDQAVEQIRLGRVPETPENLAAEANVFAALAGALVGQGENLAGLAAATEGIALARRSGDPRALAYALSMAALANGYLGRPTDMARVAEESIALSRRHGLPWEHSINLSALAGLALYGQMDPALARGYLDEMARLSVGLQNPWFKAMETMNRGRLALLEHDPAAAEVRLAQAAALFREVGDLHFSAVATSDRAHVLRRQGRIDEAVAIYHEMIGFWQQMGHRAAVAHELECLAYIAIGPASPAGSGHDHDERAVRLLAAAAALRATAGSNRNPDEQLEYDAAVAALRPRLGDAAWAAAWAEGQSLSIDQAVAYALREA